MTKGLGLRQYRACVRCRSRKTRCDLQSSGDPGKPPCAKCIREGANCVLASSRRGGNYSHLRRSKKQSTSTAQIPQLEDNSSHTTVQVPRPGVSDHHAHDSLQNPSDALLILAHAAGQPEQDQSQNHIADIDSRHIPSSISAKPRLRPRLRASNKTLQARLHEDSENITNLHPLLKDGTIVTNLVTELLMLYKESYHPYLPIVPSGVLAPENLRLTLKNESFLLTTILVIASKDVSALTNTHKAIWTYLRQRILEIALGSSKTRHISYVEGLLLLGEWTLPAQSSTDEMDSEAPWSILGLAVRLAYRLRLEDSSFQGSDNDQNTEAERKRLAWTFTYLSDRQISIRMGQAFWCRGPSLSVRFTATDFPSLKPTSSTEDLASWLQAQIEITTLFGNAHDILFASKSRTVELITRGDYVKYIDDTSRAIVAWQQAWRSITVSKHLRSCLELMREYLRLYVNAFAFQAVLYRGSSRNGLGSGSNVVDIEFPYSAMASADARHVYEALDAAESLLRIFTQDFDPGRELRFMPDRFYLYEIHSFVFLFKAHASGAISSSRYTETRHLMHRFITLLTQVSPYDDQHIASRYAKLLSRLWAQRAGQDDGQVDQDDQYRHAGTDVSVGVDVSTDLAGGPPSVLGFDAGLGGLGGYDGLEGFGGFEGLDGFLGIPAVFPYDLSLFFNGGES